MTMISRKDINSNRLLAASLARQFFTKTITFYQLIETYPKNTGDNKIDSLLILFSDLPKSNSIPVDTAGLNKIIVAHINDLEK